MVEVEGIDVDDYKERYVAYLDLLGFKERVEAAENDPDARKLLREVLHLVRDTLTSNPSLDFRLSYFSDCLVLTAERSPGALAEVFASIEALTTNLLQYDVLIRGGLTVGLAQHGKMFLYGSAVNRAVNIEVHCAKHPITLIAEQVLEDTKRHPEYFDPLIQQSDTGPYVHYLKQYQDYTKLPIYAGKVALEDPAGRIIDFMVDRLNRDTDSPLAKAQWFRDYWNRTVASKGVFDSIDATSTHRYNSRGPTLIVRRMMQRAGSEQYL